MSNQRDLEKEDKYAEFDVTDYKETHDITYKFKNGNVSIKAVPRDEAAAQKLRHQNVLFWVGILLLLGSIVVLLLPGVSAEGHSWASHTFTVIFGIFIGAFAKINGVDTPKDGE